MSLTELQDEIDRSFGDGPGHPPVEQRIAAGRQALVRRRVATSAAAAAVLAVVGSGWYAVTPGVPQGRGTGQVAVDPTPAPTPTQTPVAVPWEDDIPVRYTGGVLEIRDGVVVHERLDNPYDHTAPRHSAALDLTFKGQRHWVIIETKPTGFGYSSSVPSNGWASFADWVADQADETTGGDDGWPDTFELDAQGDVVPTAGTTVYDRTDDPQLGDSFAEPGTPTGAAVVTVPGDDASYFVVWRVVDGVLDVITTPPSKVTGATFEQLLTYARSQYASGEGLR